METWMIVYAILGFLTFVFSVAANAEFNATGILVTILALIKGILWPIFWLYWGFGFLAGVLGDESFKGPMGGQ